jgi:hypothetical protein
MLLLLLACALGDPGPAAPDSPAAQALGRVDRIRALSTEVEAMAVELEEVATAARAEQDPAARARAVADVQARMLAVGERNQALQAEVEALQQELARAAGAPGDAPAEPSP